MRQSTYSLVPVVLCGGVGSRLWPLSTAHHPKQFLPLFQNESLFSHTLQRIAVLAESHPACESPVIVTQRDQAEYVRHELLREGAQRDARMIEEPLARNTAAAITIAALDIAERHGDALMLVLPSDHAIANPDFFCQEISEATKIAAAGYLVLFGIAPTHAATGYGYIDRGEPLAGTANAHVVRGFTEKPDGARAETLIMQRHLWNSGMFLFRSSVLLAEMNRFAQTLLHDCAQALAVAIQDGQNIRIASESYTHIEAQPIDRVLMEKTDKAAVLPSQLAWSDVGSYRSLWEVLEKDAAQNVLVGKASCETVAASGNLVITGSRPVALLHVQNLVVVDTPDMLLVADRAQADMSKGLELQKSADVPSTMSGFGHEVELRPWGRFERIEVRDNYQIKKLYVEGYARTSLQRHEKRSEHWMVLAGHARVTRDHEVLHLGPYESAFIPMGSVHRIENLEEETLVLLEVQSGDYLGEDDIERFEDDYGRAAA